MKETHFDTKFNFLLYKWRSAQFSDEEIVEEIRTMINTESERALGLEGLINIAIGDKSEGMNIIRSLLAEEQKEGKING